MQPTVPLEAETLCPDDVLADLVPTTRSARSVKSTTANAAAAVDDFLKSMVDEK